MLLTHNNSFLCLSDNILKTNELLISSLLLLLLPN